MFLVQHFGSFGSNQYDHGIEEGNIESLLNTDTVVLVRSRPLDRKTKSIKIE